MIYQRDECNYRRNELAVSSHCKTSILPGNIENSLVLDLLE